MGHTHAPFPGGAYGPELVRLMADALESAWRQARCVARDAELGRLVMASAIIEQIDLGVRRQEELAATALKALDAAMRLARGDAPSLL